MIDCMADEIGSDFYLVLPEMKDEKYPPCEYELKINIFTARHVDDTVTVRRYTGKSGQTIFVLFHEVFRSRSGIYPNPAGKIFF